jgi:hypothetical protein
MFSTATLDDNIYIVTGYLQRLLGHFLLKFGAVIFEELSE